jgi:hypothetical protein
MFRLVHQLPPWPPGFSANMVAGLLDALAAGYAPWWSVCPLPPLYSSGVVYKTDRQHGSGVERFHSPWEVAHSKTGDCNDLVLWRLTELLVSGERVAADRTRAVWSGGDVHVLVRRADGSLEDPSLILAGR